MLELAGSKVCDTSHTFLVLVLVSGTKAGLSPPLMGLLNNSDNASN